MTEDVLPLEDFAAQFPDDFYSDKELLELWQEAADPAATKLARRGKLIEEQLAAIHTLEKIVAAVPPRPTGSMRGSKAVSRQG